MIQGEFFKFEPPTIVRQEPQEWKAISLRECPVPESMFLCDTAQKAMDYWRMHIATHAQFDPERESFAVLLLTTRKRIKGHHLVSVGTLKMVAIEPLETFRLAVMTASASIVMLHNHPSGEPMPSAEDITATREMIKAGQIMRIAVEDHVIVGSHGYCSLREMGFFF
jgi:DNA repair protein RadC